MTSNDSSILFNTNTQSQFTQINIDTLAHPLSNSITVLYIKWGDNASYQIIAWDYSTEKLYQIELSQ